jgi:hypothetical protein
MQGQRLVRFCCQRAFVRERLGDSGSIFFINDEDDHRHRRNLVKAPFNQ